MTLPVPPNTYTLQSSCLSSSHFADADSIMIGLLLSLYTYTLTYLLAVRLIHCIFRAFQPVQELRQLADRVDDRSQGLTSVEKRKGGYLRKRGDMRG
jgi:hypothetical protein